MKIALIVLGALAGLAAVVVVAGFLFPKEHVSASRIVLRQPPDSVWAVVRDFGAMPAWWPELKATERLPDEAGRERWRQQMKNGFDMPIEITEASPPRKLVTLIVSPPGAPFGGTWTYEIAPAPEGTAVTVTEHGWIANPFFRFMSNVVFGMHATMDDYLRSLGRKFGEPVTPQHVAG